MVQFTPSNSSKRYGAALSPAASSDMPQQQDSGSFTFKQQQQQQQQAPAGLRHSSSSVAAVSDEQLFQTPSDLVSVYIECCGSSGLGSGNSHA
jgi:hypothetical protein